MDGEIKRAGVEKERERERKKEKRRRRTRRFPLTGIRRSSDV